MRYTVMCDGIMLHDPEADIPEEILHNPQVAQEVNAADSFTFTIYPTHPAYTEIERMASVITVHEDDRVLFHGRVINDDIGWLNNKKISCEGDFAYFCDTVVRPYEYTGSVSGYVTMLVTQHNAQVPEAKRFTVRNVTVVDPNNTITRANSGYPNTMEELQNKLVKLLGGFLITEYDEEDDVIYLDYLADSTLACNQTVRLSENLLDYAETNRGEDLVTALIPLGAKDEDGNRITIESVNNGLDYVVNQTAAAAYGLIYATNVWDDVTLPQNLKAKGEELLAEICAPIKSIELTAADLHMVDPEVDAFRFFAYVYAEDDAHQIDGRYLITKKVTRLTDPAGNKITFGSTKRGLTQQTMKDLSKIEEQTADRYVTSSQVETAINKATETISGAYGGNVIVRYDEDRHPYEYLFMDTASEETAVNVVRINYQGIGLSTTGVDGPYAQAIINGIGINASQVVAGILQGIEIIGEHGSIGGWDMSEDQIGKAGTYDSTDVDSLTLAYIINVLNGSITEERAIEECPSCDVNKDGHVDLIDMVVAYVIMLGLTDDSGAFSTALKSGSPYGLYEARGNGKLGAAAGIFGVFANNMITRRIIALDEVTGALGALRVMSNDTSFDGSIKTGDDVKLAYGKAIRFLNQYGTSARASLDTAGLDFNSSDNSFIRNFKAEDVSDLPTSSVGSKFIRLTQEITVGGIDVSQYTKGVVIASTGGDAVFLGGYVNELYFGYRNTSGTWYMQRRKKAAASPSSFGGSNNTSGAWSGGGSVTPTSAGMYHIRVVAETTGAYQSTHFGARILVGGSNKAMQILHNGGGAVCGKDSVLTCEYVAYLDGDTEVEVQCLHDTSGCAKATGYFYQIS